MSRGNNGTVGTCASCLAWGRTFSHGLCVACYQFSRKHAVGECVGCGRQQPVRKQYCRLCWCQARTLARESGHPLHTAYAETVRYLDQVHRHQLFFADMLWTRGASTTPAPRRPGTRGRPRKLPPIPAGNPATSWVQLFLFNDLRRDYTRVDERDHANPNNPWLIWAQYLAHQRSETYGWSERTLQDVNQALTILLSGHIEGDAVRYSEMFSALRAVGLSVERPADVLHEMGVLIDDRSSPFEEWLERKLDGVAPGIAREVAGWLRTLRDGGPRRRPRDINTVRQYGGCLRPVLLGWSTHYDHLREVTREDVLAALDTVKGSPRRHLLFALRSLFSMAKKTGAVFRDPTSRIRIGDCGSKLVQPLPAGQIQRTAMTATRPVDRLIIALAAVHAARSGAIRAMRLDDIDLGNRRLTIAGRSRPLDDLTHQALLNWLDYRRSRWPNTANPHLIVSQKTALELGPVSHVWIDAGFRGKETTIERLRVDRQLEEALTHGPDPLHLAVVFDLDPKTAIRYATSARQLLETSIERDTPE